MNQSETRARLIAKEILLSLLRDGEIPTGEKIAKLLAARTDGIVLSEPELAQIDHQFEYREASSASKMNNITRTATGDLAVLLQSYLDNEKDYIDYLGKTLDELRALKNRVRSLVNRAERMLLTTDRTEGLLETFADDFSDAQLIDLESTTAEVDLNAQSVYLGYELESLIDFPANANFENMRESDILISVLNRTSRRAPGTRDSSVLDIFSESRVPWIFSVSDTSIDPVSIEVKIDFTNSIYPSGDSLYTRKITIDPLIIGGSIVLTAQHSMDGVAWEDLPVQNPDRRLNGPTVFMVGELSFKWLRLIMTKDTHTSIDQTGRRLFDFGIRSIKLESAANRLSPSAVFRSQQLYSLGEDGERKGIRAATLAVSCEHIESDTSIDYDIIFVSNEGEESEPKRIVPSSRLGEQGPKIAEFSAIETVPVSSYIESAGERFTGYQSSTNRILDTRITEENVQVWRNLGRNTRYLLIQDSSGALIEDGWAFRDGLYHTYMLVDEPGGAELDFGPSPVWIDQQRVTGRVRLSEGVHQFKVRPESWYSLEGLTNVSSFNRVTKAFTGDRIQYGSTIDPSDEPTILGGQVVVDRLYPYNHKLIIEGLTYGPAFEDAGTRQKYQTHTYAAHHPFFVSDNEFITRISRGEYGVYSRVQLSDGEDGVETGIMVKWTGGAGEISREEFLVIEQFATTASAVILQATLRTRNPNRSPSLDGYQIRVIS